MALGKLKDAGFAPDQVTLATPRVGRRGRYRLKVLVGIAGGTIVGGLIGGGGCRGRGAAGCRPASTRKRLGRQAFFSYSVQPG